MRNSIQAGKHFTKTTLLYSLLSMGACILLLVGSGCSGSTTPEPAPATEEAPEQEHEHQHEDDSEHAEKDEHGDDHEHDEDGHHHHHNPPHGGMLLEIGDHVAHVEIVVDAETGEITLYALGGEAENPVRLTDLMIPLQVTLEDGESFELSLQAVENALTGETGGDTSQFAASDERLIGIEHFDGLIPAISIRGVDATDVAFHFPDHDHDHDHDHSNNEDHDDHDH